MAQTWCDLLFAHYPVPADQLRRVLPAALNVDLWERTAWIGIVPFRMEGIRPRGLFAVPMLSSTPEINVRTYVTIDGKPGVYFFSLDAANAIAVRVARRFFHLPYFDAEMSLAHEGERVRYASRRQDGQAEFRGIYGPAGEVALASAGSFAHWLTERYCFYTLNRQGTVLRGNIHHEPWPLQPGEADIQANTMTSPLGLTLPDTEPILHFARRLPVVAWMPETVRSGVQG